MYLNWLQNRVLYQLYTAGWQWLSRSLCCHDIVNHVKCVRVWQGPLCTLFYSTRFALRFFPRVWHCHWPTGWTGVNIYCMVFTHGVYRNLFVCFSTRYTSSLLLSVILHCHLSTFCIHTSLVTYFLFILLACHSCVRYNLSPMAVFLFDLSLKGIT